MLPRGVLAGVNLFSVQFSPEGYVFATVSLRLIGFGRSPARWVPSLDKVFVVVRVWKNIPPQAGPRTRRA